MRKINKKRGKMVENLVKNRARGLEDGKRSRARFWERFKRGFSARNPFGNFHLSHTAPRGGNSQINSNNYAGNLGKNGAGRTRRWERGLVVGNNIIVILILLTSLIILVSALTPKEELSQLENELTNSGYSWLINYSLNNFTEQVSKVIVIRENDDIPLAIFDNITQSGWYKIFLTNLDDNETQDVFDLKVLGNVDFDYVIDPEGDTNTWICTANNLFSNAACWSLGSVPVAGENVIFNGTYRGSCNVTNNTMPQNLNSFTVADYSGTIYFEPLFAVGTWGSWQGSQLWNVTNNINITNGTMKIYGDAYNASG
ncbi:MAG: hypothetical protein NT076_04605, partial [Candidatus Pacearchaeota archaeon]|nr:hypothetical protein [Candidatus Pacearchaeota archaeon]